MAFRERSRLLLAMVVAATVVLAPAPGTAADESRMTGRVADAETQAPIADAEIELENASGGTGFFRARTNRSGEFTLQGIAADRYYNLTVSARGYADFVLGGWRFPSAQRAVDVFIPLDRAGSIEALVTGANGKTPIAGARVSVRSESPAPWWEYGRPPIVPMFSDRKGRVLFEGLTAGYWTVVAEASGLLTSETRRVAVRRGERTPVPVRLARPASLSGVVRLADGTGVAGLSVVARGPAEGVGSTGPEGEFTVPDLPPGRYRLEVQHEGFEPARSRDVITLAEGESRGRIDLSVVPRSPELAFVLQREVFAPDEAVKLGLRSFRIGEAELSLFRIPIERLLDSESDFRRYAEGADTSGLVRERTWTHRTADGPAYSWREEEVTIVAEPTPGVYLLSGRAQDLERRVIFFVSDLGLLVKRSAGSLLVSAASLKTSRGIEGAAVFTNPNPDPLRPVLQGQNWSAALSAAKTRGAVTDGEGLLQMPLPGGHSSVRVVAVSETHGVAVAESPLAPAASQGGHQLFLYTDRPLYRLGQAVYWKAIARKLASGGYAMPDVTQASLSLTGPEGATVEVPPARLSARGSADGVIELPPALPLGEWVLSAAAGTARGQASLAIEQYRKPEFGVEVTPDREVYVNGDEVRFRIAASYFFGAPVFGAAVRYNLFESRLQRGDEWGEEPDYEAPEVGFGRVLKTGETRTDADGRVTLAFTPERVTYDRRLTLEVEVVDAANRLVRGRGSAVMGRGLFTVAARPVSRLVMVGQPIAIEVITRDHTGKPVSAAVMVELDQEAWNPIERRYGRSTRPLATATVTTGADGRAMVSLDPAPARSGNLTVRARAEDTRGNRITDESSVWVYDPRVWQYAYRYPTLEAFPDRNRYQPGDTAKIVVNTEVGYAAVLATVEAREIADVKVVHLFGNTGLVTFPIRPEYAPNVYVSLHVRKGKEMLSRTLDLAVEAARHDLQIVIKPDREQYRPGEQARVEIETRGEGNAPVDAEVSLGVVDEAIYTLRPDRTPHPHEVFYGHRPNWVTTAVSFPVLYYGGADKGGRDDVRRDFRDAAFWGPSIETGAAGKAEVSFRFPDNLTTWRLTSRGATRDTRVGQAVAKTLVTKDIVARLAPPRDFVAGDRATLVSVVNNRTSSPLVGVEESIEVRGPIKSTGPSTRRSSIPANGESRSEWSVEVTPDLSGATGDTLEAAFVFRARTKADTDALELRTPVLPRAVAERSHGAGVLEGASATPTIAMPSNLIRLGSEVRLDLSPSPAAMMVAAADALIAQPNGSTEQTANALRSAAALVTALRRAGLEAPGWQDPASKLAPFVRRLITLQRPEGGWGWWDGSESDPYLSALALDALARWAKVEPAAEGIDPALQRGVFQVPRMLFEVRSLDGEAYALAHLGRLLSLSDGSAPGREMNQRRSPRARPAPGGADGTPERFPDLRQRLEELALSTYSGRERLGTAGLALAAIGHADLGRTREARALLDLLMKRASAGSDGLHWPPDPGFEDAWFGDDEENTAYALSAMMAITPGDARASSVVQWLAHRRRGEFWKSTRVTAPVSIALSEYLARNPGEIKLDYRLEVQWNGEPILARAVGPKDAYGGREFRVRIPGAKLRGGANRLTISKRGSGSLYYSWASKAMVPSPGPAPVSGLPLQITREYLHAERTADRRGRPRFLATPLAAGEAFRVGEQVLVRIRIQASKPLRHLVVEDPRVTGVEVDALAPEGVERPWDAHVEEWDDRVAFFLERVQQGETVIEYLIRPEMAGRFTALPASARGVYEPDLLTRSSEVRLVVRSK